MLFIVAKIDIENGMRPASPPPTDAPVRRQDARPQVTPRPAGGSFIVSEDMIAPGSVQFDPRRAIAGLVSFPLQRRDTVKEVHLSRTSAESTATRLSQENPGNVYGIFTLDVMYETAEQPVPPVIQKQFNDRGELLLNEQG